jgi:hypothetical protein
VEKILETDPALAGLRARIGREPGAFYGPWGNDFAALYAARTCQRKIGRSLTALLVGETRARLRRHPVPTVREDSHVSGSEARLDRRNVDCLL